MQERSCWYEIRGGSGDRREKKVLGFKIYFVASTDRLADELVVGVHERGTEDHNGDLMNASPAVISLYGAATATWLPSAYISSLSA